MDVELPSGLVAVLSRSTVGPDAEGFGDTHVMYPAADPPVQAQRWSGWPLGWDTPVWSTWGGWPGWYGNRVSTVFSCVDLNARILSTLPVYVSDRQGNPQPPPTWAVNPEPRAYSDWCDFAKSAFYSYQLRGEVFLWATARSASGWPLRFVVLNPDWVNVEYVDGQRSYALQGAPLDAADVCHIRYSTAPGDARGHGPLEAVARNLCGADALERYAAELASRGGVPWGVLTHPANLKSEQADVLRDRWLSASADRHGAPAILSGGMTLQTLTLSPRDMALLELRTFDEVRIATALGVPPYLVGLPAPDGMTYDTAALVADWHWRATLRPFATAFSAAFSWWALPGRQRLEWNGDEYTRPAYGDLAPVLVQLVQAGLMTVDEARIALHLGPLANADDDREHFVLGPT